MSTDADSYVEMTREADQQILLAIRAERLELFIEDVRKYLEKEDKVRDGLMETPIDLFSTLVYPIIRKKWETEGLDESGLVLQDQEKRYYYHIKKLIIEVAVKRSICTWCFGGEESIRGGRNGGEQYTHCSNPKCITHTFRR
jgi:hypothetical protein